MAFERIAQQRIRQAMDEGAFDRLPNAGQRLDFEEYFALPEALRMAYSILKNAGCAPPEVELLKEIARLESELTGAASDADRDRTRRLLTARRIELAVKLERGRARR